MTQQTTEVVTDVREYIVERFLFGQGGETLSNDASFLEEGIVDSTGVLEIVMFLEQRFGIKIKDDELVPDNLDSVSKVASFVVRKLK
uniref:Acyl carrier protein n=1 Tax=uncultured bacterium lac193 TaxID=1447243 RepID=X2LCI7_9BACT|nr:Acyl carrier protein [uncultured bacterium lac193]